MNSNDVIKLPVTKEVTNKTITNTIRKYEYTHKSLMYNRTPVELLDNIFMGDMAKNALFDYLRTRCTSLIIDYDEIRTDNFKEADGGWDFKVGNNLIKVEVKSSIPTRHENIQEIINKRDIKITASHNNGASYNEPENLESEIHAQIYFYAKAYKNGYDSFDKLLNDLTANPQVINSIINSAKYNEPLFFGWNTKQNIIKYRNTLKFPTWTFPGTKRIYWKCPISDAMRMPQLIEFINSH